MAKYIAKVQDVGPGAVRVSFSPTHGGADIPDLFCNADGCQFKDGQEYEVADSQHPEEAEKIKGSKKGGKK